MTTLHFNVPASTGSGTIVAPPVADQYPIDTTSFQSSNGGVGNDWGYFGAFPNSNTGLTPWQAYRTAFDVQLPPSSTSGNQIRITGFGVDTGSANQTTQTHVGSLTSITTSSLSYNADTTGGNSGSPVVDGKGRLIGLNFDRVFEGVAGDFGWSKERSRNVVCDIRYVLWVVESVMPSPALLGELLTAN